MNSISIHEVSSTAKIASFEDTAMFLNLFYHEQVEELLECFTDFTDYDIIQELVDHLHLKIVAVIEPGYGVYGFINKEVKA